MDIKQPKKRLKMGDVIAPRSDIVRRRKPIVEKIIKTGAEPKPNDKPKYNINIGLKKPNFEPSSFTKFFKIFSIYLVIIVFACLLYLPNIASFPEKTLINENAVDSLQALQSSLVNDVSFAPEKFVKYALDKINLAEHYNARLINSTAIIFAILCFFGVVREWVSKRVALMSTLLFATSSWTIFHARSDDFGGIYFLIIPLLFTISNSMVKKSPAYKTFLLLLVLSAGLYAPGAIWCLLAGFVFLLIFYRGILAKINLKSKLLFALTPIVLLLPATYFISKDVSNLSKLLGLPIDSSLASNNLANLPNELFLNGVNDPALWLPGTPIIEGVTIILALSGAIYLARSDINPFNKWMLSFFSLLSLALIILNGSTLISVALPLIYLVSSVGITFLLEQWFHIFPRNPIARSFGIVIVSLIVVMVSIYHTSRYYIAWPRSDEYKTVYRN